jgi:hypothetical protein
MASDYYQKNKNTILIKQKIYIKKNKSIRKRYEVLYCKENKVITAYENPTKSKEIG